MKLNKALKKNKYSSLQLKLMMNIIYTSNWFLDRQNTLFKEHGLISQHYSILRILRGMHPEPMPPGAIKDVLLGKSNDLTRLIDKMVVLGLVTKHICPINKRKVDVEITEKGLEVLQGLDQVILSEDLMLANCINDVEAEFMINILDKIRRVVN